jgi:hypothetical protein
MSTQVSTRLRFIAPIAAMLVVGIVFAAFSAGSNAQKSKRNDRVENTDAAISFRNEMRRLWDDHTTWTRLAIISLSDDLPDQDQSVGRLLQNQSDIGDAIKPFYGDAAGDQLTALLRDHIFIAADIIAAAKAVGATAADEAGASWYANADEIATFLSAANPEAWPLDHMKQMMREHLDLTLAEATARLTKDYSVDVAAYDKIHLQILEMADMLSLGIINQFDKQFR